MLALLSPAKTLDLDPADPKLPHTLPAFMAETQALHRSVKKLSARALAELMDLSESLAELNRERFQDWTVDHLPPRAKQALLTFAGDVYVGLDAGSLKRADLAFAQEHLRVLSGFYGLLRPLDLILPYRLEMGSKVQTRRGKDLYTFWGDRLAKRLVAEVDGHADRTVVNLASNEYWKAVDGKVLAKAEVPVLEIAFQEIRDGEAVTYALFAKKARGMMARHLVTKRVDRVAGLRAFATADYRLDEARSREGRWVFTRPFRKVGG